MLPLLKDPNCVPKRMSSSRNCERCWHNPETPPCELCCAADPSSSFFIRAIVEKPPKTLCAVTWYSVDPINGSELIWIIWICAQMEDSSEYLSMDAGFKEFNKYNSYCNVPTSSAALDQPDTNSFPSVQSKWRFQSLSVPSSPAKKSRMVRKCQHPSWRSIFRSVHSLRSSRSDDSARNQTDWQWRTKNSFIIYWFPYWFIVTS